MTRVLQFIGAMNYCGTEIYLRNVLSKGLEHEIKFFFTRFGENRGDMDGEILDLGGEFVDLPAYTKVRQCVKALKEKFYCEKYDVVHVHHPEFAGYMLKYAQRAGIKGRFLHVHNTFWNSTERGLRGLLFKVYGRHRTLGAMTRGIAVSRDAARYIFGPGWKKDQQVVVWHCGIDLRPFGKVYSTEAIKREFNIPQNAKVVGHVGSFTAQKNHVFLLRIARSIIAKDPTCIFLLIGDGILRKKIETEADSLGIRGNVRFAGVRTDVPRLLCVMDVFLFPSLYEGLGLALVEAQAASVPCIVSTMIPDEAILVRSLVNSLDLNDPTEEWAEECLRMTDLKGLYEEGGLEAIRRSDFNIDVSAVRLIEEYHKWT